MLRAPARLSATLRQPLGALTQQVAWPVLRYLLLPCALQQRLCTTGALLAGMLTNAADASDAVPPCPPGAASATASFASGAPSLSLLPPFVTPEMSGLGAAIDAAQADAPAHLPAASAAGAAMQAGAVPLAAHHVATQPLCAHSAPPPAPPAAPPSVSYSEGTLRSPQRPKLQEADGDKVPAEPGGERGRS